MNKKIKIIELLNKIANGKEVPQKIKIKDKIYEYKENIYGTGYCRGVRDDLWWLKDYFNLDESSVLNDYVEVLEDNTEEIEEFEHYSIFSAIVGKENENIENELRKMSLKINELVRAYNKSRKEKEVDV